MELVVLHLVDSILVVRQVDGGVPGEVLGLHRNSIQCKLDTLVGHLTHIGIHPTIHILRGGNRIAPDQVLGLFVIVLDSTIETSSQESKIKTDIQHGCCFPLEVRVGILCSTIGAIGLTVIDKCTCSTVCDV